MFTLNTAVSALGAGLIARGEEGRLFEGRERLFCFLNFGFRKTLP